MEYIESLRVFRSIVESKSFTRAADIHGMTRPAVSRAMAALEERIGCRLLNRTTRQISLTEAAERFYEGCVRILDDLDTLEANVANHTREADGVLRLVAHTTAALNRLVPLIARFKRDHPKVTLEVTLTERPVDLVADGFDVGVVVPYMITSETTVVRLLERMPFVIVATPHYLRASSTPRNPEQLAEHLFVPMLPSLRRPVITFRSDGADEVTMPLRFEVSSNNPTFNRDMVLQGLGIGIAPRDLVEPELASGKLVRLLTDFQLVDDTVDILLAYSNRALMPAKVRAFIDYAAAFFADLTASR
ncbi:MAG TPA: LysR family transcriptional regulator [Paraburkholderia sp.]|jgi:DNA-binding transcriptional LysR family regulator|nr:LysR family transcriptional regulator [Paraburkholderia sp.]